MALSISEQVAALALLADRNGQHGEEAGEHTGASHAVGALGLLFGALVLELHEAWLAGAAHTGRLALVAVGHGALRLAGLGGHILDKAGRTFLAGSGAISLEAVVATQDVALLGRGSDDVAATLHQGKSSFALTAVVIHAACLAVLSVAFGGLALAIGQEVALGADGAVELGGAALAVGHAGGDGGGVEHGHTVATHQVETRLALGAHHFRGGEQRVEVGSAVEAVSDVVVALELHAAHCAGAGHLHGVVALLALPAFLVLVALYAVL